MISILILRRSNSVRLILGMNMRKWDSNHEINGKIWENIGTSAKLWGNINSFWIFLVFWSWLLWVFLLLKPRVFDHRYDWVVLSICWYWTKLVFGQHLCVVIIGHICPSIHGRRMPNLGCMFKSHVVMKQCLMIIIYEYSWLVDIYIYITIYIYDMLIVFIDVKYNYY